MKDTLDRAGVPAKAEVTVELKPWEQLMCDIVGIAPISRDEHRTGLPVPVSQPAQPATETKPACAATTGVPVYDLRHTFAAQQLSAGIHFMQ